MSALSITAAIDGTSIVGLPDGLSLAIHSVGPKEGPTLFHLHGGPSSRLEVEAFADAAHAAGVRIVGIDRYGIGLSSPVPKPKLGDICAHVVAIADVLGVARFAVSGWSEGGPWALACAHGIPRDRLALSINCGGGCYGAFGDNWCAQDVNMVDRFGGFLALHMSPAFKLMYDVLEWQILEHQETFWTLLLDGLCAYDRAICMRPGFKELFIAAERECFRQGSTGLVRDAEALYHQWDFDVRDIEAPVIVLQGAADTLVPPQINRLVAERTPGAIWREIPEAGHFVMVGELARTLSDVKAALKSV